MDPITLSLLMAGGQALLPAIKSMKQGQRLKDLPDATRPDFQIPEAATEQLGIARSIAGNRNMPGYDEALDKIDNQTNRMIGDVKAAGGNMQDIMAAMASANVGAGMAKRDLDITNAKSYLGSLQNLQGQLGSYANWQNAQQQDEMKAYNDEMARRASLDTARQQNMQNAVGAVGQGLATGLGYQMNMNLMNKMYPGATPTTPGATPPSTAPGEVKGIDISALPNPDAPVNIQPQLQNRGPIDGQQADAQQVANSLMAAGIIPGTPTSTPNVNQIASSLQGQMGSDFASTSGVNNLPINIQNPTVAQVMTESPYNGAEFIPTPPPNTTLNPITSKGKTGPVMTSPNPMEGNEFSANPTAKQQQVISILKSLNIIPTNKISNVNTDDIINTLSTIGLIPGGNNYNEQDAMNKIMNMPEMTSGKNVTPNFQPTVSLTEEQRNQIPFDMLTPDQQQKRILELMLLGKIK